MTLETLGLPDGNIDRIDTVTDASDDTRNDHLDLFGGRGLKNGADYHDPTSPCKATLAAPSIGCEKGKDGSKETAQIIDSSDYAIQVFVWIVELLSERWETDDGSQDSLIITKQLEKKSKSEGATKGRQRVEEAW